MTSRHTPAERGANNSGLRARVGLTRHCVNSGVITLPFALQESLPEGDFSVVDADAGTTHQVRVTAGRPRRMQGLGAFVQAYGLQVNDRIEILIQPDGGVRLRAERKTPASQSQTQDNVAAAAPDAVAASNDPGRVLVGDATHDRASDGTVVERIGTVTVRRINTRPNDFPSEATLANAEDIERALAARNAELDASAVDESDPPVDHFLLSDEPDMAASVEDEPQQVGLFATASESPRPALGLQQRQDDQADSSPTVARNAREEALSHAGDLRSQMLRWFMRPDVPVIVPFERLMQDFGLTREVVADVIDGIVEDPPESLSLTLIREGTLRVAQTEVVSDANHQRAS